MTPEELAKVKQKFPISETVARLSLGAGVQPTGVTVSCPQPTPNKRIRQSSKPLLNKLETEWFHVLKDTYPEDCKICPQSVRFKLANGIWYKPDFVVFGEGMYAYEVKGPHAFRGGFENLKLAANRYPEFKWYLVWKENGEWCEQEVLP